MRSTPLIFGTLTVLLATSAIARADSFSIDGLVYSGTLNGIRSGKLSMTIGGRELLFDLDKIQLIMLDAVPKLTEAEQARSNDPKKAAALYKQVIPTINKPELKQLVQWRAIRPTDEDGRWLEAVVLFLDLYQAAPSETLWKSKPGHFPAANSSMLGDSADRVAAAVKTAKTDDAKKNLKTFLLEIYTKAGNTQDAQRLAKELFTGIAEVPTAAEPAAAPGTATGGTGMDLAGSLMASSLTEIENAIKARNFDGAIKQADALLSPDRIPPATGETAVQLFAFKARAYEGQDKPGEAAAALLRIPAHYPSSPGAPAALLRAATLEKQLAHPDAARALYREIIEKYPDSTEAVDARKSQWPQ